MPLLLWVVSNVLLAMLVGLAAWTMQRSRRPALAHGLWVVALIKLVTPPLASVPVGVTSGPMACALGLCGCDHHSGMQVFVRDTLPWVLLSAWAIGAGATASIAAIRWLRFRRLIAGARPASPEWQTLAERMSGQLGLRRTPPIRVVPGRIPPMVIPGWPGPSILLPFDLMSRVSGAQEGALLLHELVHIKRRDHWVRLLELVVRLAYWWLPLPGIAGRQLRACEEACCDAAVVDHLPERRRDYAELLLDVLDFTSMTPDRALQQATAMSAVASLEQRLRTILEAPPSKRQGRPVAAFVFVILACAILPCQLQSSLVAYARASTPPAPETDSSERQFDPASVSICCPS